jgi:hypothetical protein
VPSSHLGDRTAVVGEEVDRIRRHDVQATEPRRSSSGTHRTPEACHGPARRVAWNKQLTPEPPAVHVVSSHRKAVAPPMGSGRDRGTPRAHVGSLQHVSVELFISVVTSAAGV